MESVHGVAFLGQESARDVGVREGGRDNSELLYELLGGHLCSSQSQNSHGSAHWGEGGRFSSDLVGEVGVPASCTWTSGVKGVEITWPRGVLIFI